ncbi:hypothetical protein SEUCBS139899_000380 [Sporothrix eucalyptigena]|uniref:Myb-like DNA-binding domain-containing protein n=1 Tax=Sporothrix eucalyptigena TaxID=1812306 RepID=A0ABP0BDC2_9PEZI
MSDIDSQDVPVVGTIGPEFPDPNPQEAMFFYNMIKNMNNQPDIDWDGVATDSGFKNAAVAKKRFYQIKQKLGLDSRSTLVSKIPRKSRGCKAAADGQDADKKPCKVTKRRKTSGIPVTPGRTALPTQRPRVSESPSNSMSDEQLTPCGSDDDISGCITVGFLKKEGGVIKEEDGGI